MRRGVRQGSAKSNSPSRICSFKQRNAQTSKSPALPLMTLPTALPKLIAFDLVRDCPILIKLQINYLPARHHFNS